MPKPLVKYLGGKTKILNALVLYVPNNYSTYVEPFVGGGALAFKLIPSSAVLSDTNTELMNFYKQVRDNPLELLELCKSFETSEESYYIIRSYDRPTKWREETSCLTRAARFLFLNRTSFNGMWRVNQSGRMNAPYGKYDSITFPSKQHMLAISKFLRTTVLLNVDFYDTLDYIDRDAFVYLDPPLIPYSETSKFTQYSSKGFDIADQHRLKDFCDELDRRGTKFLLSNSDSSLTREIFGGYSIESLYAYHCVGAATSSRRNKGEVFVRNYEGDCVGLFL